MMQSEAIHVVAPSRIAAKFLGGFVPAVAYHYGVLEVLREHGFVLREGFRGADEARETGPPGIDLAVGSSAGAFFVVAACAGIDRTELSGAIEAKLRDPFKASYLGEGDGLIKKTWDWVRGGPRVSWRNRRTWKAWAAESTMNTLFPLWRLDAIGRYLGENVLGGRDWSDLRTEAAILAVDLNHPVTYIVGEQEAPILQLFNEQPVEPETIHLILGSEGRKIVDAFVSAGIPAEHPVLSPFCTRPEIRNTSLRISGVPMPCAAIGSMATYPFYEPVALTDKNGAPYQIGHYPVVVEDGEDRNTFTTDVAEETGADLIFVSSISAPYKYLHGLGSLAEHGYSALHQQKAAHSRDAKQEHVMRSHRVQRELHRESRAILEASGCGEDALSQLDHVFERLARIGNIRIRIYPDTDIAAENRILRTLDPLEFTPKAVERAFDLGRIVARRVLAGYRFEFLDRAQHHS